MRSLNDREIALNMYFVDGKGYGEISKLLGISENTIKSWGRRYRIAHNIPKRSEAKKLENQIRGEMLHGRKIPSDVLPEKRIKDLEMEVDLLRNFLLEIERRSIRK